MHWNVLSGQGAVSTNFQVGPLAPGDGEEPGEPAGTGEPEALGEPTGEAEAEDDGMAEADGAADAPPEPDGAAEADAAADPEGAGSWPGKSEKPGVDPHATRIAKGRSRPIRPRAGRDPNDRVGGTGRSLAAGKALDQSKCRGLRPAVSRGFASPRRPSRSTPPAASR